MWWLLLTIVWLGIGVVGFGLDNAVFLKKFSNIYHLKDRWNDVRRYSMILAGPVGIFALLCVFKKEAFQHGLIFTKPKDMLDLPMEELIRLPDAGRQTTNSKTT